MMNVLVIGQGAREHAIVWKLAQSPKVSRLYCAPDNPGVAAVRGAECVPIAATDFDALIQFAEQHDVDLTVVGPETPLIAGIVDAFEAKGLRVFGPSAEPAQLEGSKVFAKQLMQNYNIPTADFVVHSDFDQATAYAREYFAANPGKKLVVKVDGEAAGKGVIVCPTLAEAEEALTRILIDKAFGSAGDQVVLEEGLEGFEISLMAFTDGATVVPMLPAQDHKRVLDGDQGPNTGGMGCYAPVPFVGAELIERATETVLRPAVAAIRDTGLPYKGVIYAGLMVMPEGDIKVIEFNARFGDPEAEVVLPLLETDLADLLIGVTDAHLDEVQVTWREGVAVCVVMASGGYPGAYEKGYPVEGIEHVTHLSDVVLFQAGTAFNDQGQVVTNGGRVLTVTGIGTDFAQARGRTYAAAGALHFENAHYRTDIGYQALANEAIGDGQPEDEGDEDFDFEE
ncbi:MAG TPA: phosphoribosylamine--glycine ligase [Capsulimonadaceae bacterium]|nr:phosphoribosylamine--glycine ligase [Capsulimonadaceae bacterium]